MAKTTGTASLVDLLAAGTLMNGEELAIRRRSKPAVIGVLLADGTITVGDQNFKTPSGAAREALGVETIDGWRRWRVIRLGDKTLDELRNL
jgi:hypothetical protein